MRAAMWCSLLTPLLFVPGFFFPYVTPRAFFFRGVIEISIALLAWLFWRGKSVRWSVRADPIFLALVALVGVGTISAALSPSFTRSFYGSFERMGGVLAWAHWTAYYAILRMTMDDGGWVIFLRIAVGISALVAGIAVSQLNDFALANPGAIFPQPISTVGNAGLLAAYLLFGIAFAGILLLRGDRYSLLYAAAAVLDFGVIVLSQNRSIIGGVLLGAFFAAVCAALLGKDRRWRRGLLLALAAAVMLAPILWVARSRPESEFSKGLPGALTRIARTTPGGDTHRWIQWRVGMRAFNDNPIIGVGPENHAIAWARYVTPEEAAIDGPLLFDRVHNEFLEALETTGLLGFISLVAIWTGAFVMLVRGYRARRITIGELSILSGAHLAYAWYWMFWFKDVNSTQMWVALLALTAARVLSPPPAPGKSARSGTLRMFAGPAIIAAMAAVFFLDVVSPLRVARALSAAQAVQSPLIPALDALDIAYASPGPQTSDVAPIFGSYLISLVPGFPRLHPGSSVSNRLGIALGTATAGAAREVAHDPENDRLRIAYSRVLLAGGYFSRDRSRLVDGVKEIQRAIELSPQRGAYRFVLVSVLLNLGDTIDAFAAADEAVRMSPQPGAAFFQLARIEASAERADSAFGSIIRARSFGYEGEGATYVRVANSLERKGDIRDAAQLYSWYLEGAFGKSVWTGRPLGKAHGAGDVPLAEHLPVLFLQLNDIRRARLSANAVMAIDPALAPLVAGFDSSLARNGAREWIVKGTIGPVTVTPSGSSSH